MAKPKSKRGRRIVISVVIILIILVILAIPWLYLQFTNFTYDDFRTLAAENEEPYTLADYTPEAGLTVSLDKADLYSLLLEYMPPEKLMEQIPVSPALKPEIEELGFTLRPDSARVSIRLKALGFLHLPLQLRGSVEKDGDGLILTPETVYIGPFIPVTAEKAAELLRQPELIGPYVIDPADYGAEGLSLSVGMDDVRLTVPLPSMLPELMDSSVMDLTERLAFYKIEDLPAASVTAMGEGFASGFRTAIREGTTMDLLTSYLAMGDKAAYNLLKDVTGWLPEGSAPTDEAVASERAAVMKTLAAGQRKYESLLKNLRKLYQKGMLTLVPGGFQMEERPLTLEDLGWSEGEPPAWRIVYLYNYSATHQAATADMPAADELPYTDKSALPEGGVRFADLGILLPNPRGEMMLMYRTAVGELVMNCLPKEYYTELLEAELTPTLCTDDIPDIPRWTLTPSTAEDLMPVYYLIPTD